MGNFNRNDRGGSRGGGRFFGRDGFGRKSFDRGGSRGGGDNGGRGDRQMFKTVCSNCGKDCEVPFRPTNSKPVYCSDCFEKMGGRNDRRDDRPRFNDRSQGGNTDQYKGQFENLNIKLDKILRLLEPKKTTAETPKDTQEVVVMADMTKDVEKEVKVAGSEAKDTPKSKKISRKATPKVKE
jgi:CxxC-x17-CxxC domain-containing protein